jgi:hypothetical protein
MYYAYTEGQNVIGFGSTDVSENCVEIDCDLFEKFIVSPLLIKKYVVEGSAVVERRRAFVGFQPYTLVKSYPNADLIFTRSNTDLSIKLGPRLQRLKLTPQEASRPITIWLTCQRNPHLLMYTHVFSLGNLLPLKIPKWQSLDIRIDNYFESCDLEDTRN